MEKKSQGMTFGEKIVTSFAIWFGTFSLGLCNGVIGPSLIQLSIKFGTSVATVSKVFTFQICSCLFGALTSGFIFNHVNRQLASVIFLIVMGISAATLPTVTTLPMFFVAATFTGFAWGGYDTSQTVWMIQLWEGDAAAYIQTQHFSYALGAFVSPMIVKFCLPYEEHLSTLDTTLVPVEGTEPAPLLWVAFIVAGVISLLAGFFLLVLYKVRKYDKSRVGSVRKEGDLETKRFHHVSIIKIVVILLSSLFLGTYTGTESTAFQFLPSFSHFIPLQMSLPDGAAVVSAFAAAFTLGRGIGIALVFKVRPEILMLVNLLIICTGNCFLLFSTHSTLAVYTGAILLGLGFSTVYAAFFGFIEKYMKIGNVVGAVLIAVGMFVCGLYPLFVGTFIEHMPFVMVYTNFYSIVTGTVLFSSIFFLCDGTGSGMVKHDEESGCWRPLLPKSRSNVCNELR